MRLLTILLHLTGLSLVLANHTHLSCGPRHVPTACRKNTTLCPDVGCCAPPSEGYCAPGYSKTEGRVGCGHGNDEEYATCCERKDPYALDTGVVVAVVIAVLVMTVGMARMHLARKVTVHTSLNPSVTLIELACMVPTVIHIGLVTYIKYYPDTFGNIEAATECDRNLVMVSVKWFEVRQFQILVGFHWLPFVVYVGLFHFLFAPIPGLLALGQASSGSEDEELENLVRGTDQEANGSESTEHGAALETGDGEVARPRRSGHLRTSLRSSTDLPLHITSFQLLHSLLAVVMSLLDISTRMPSSSVSLLIVVVSVVYVLLAVYFRPMWYLISERRGSTLELRQLLQDELRRLAWVTLGLYVCYFIDTSNNMDVRLLYMDQIGRNYPCEAGGDGHSLQEQGPLCDQDTACQIECRKLSGLQGWHVVLVAWLFIFHDRIAPPYQIYLRSQTGFLKRHAGSVIRVAYISLGAMLVATLVGSALSLLWTVHNKNAAVERCVGVTIVAGTAYMLTLTVPPLVLRVKSLTGQLTNASSYDVFLAHDWGIDQDERDNHARVSRINQALKAAPYNLITWFDEERMKGQIRNMMIEGIDKSKVVCAFLTLNYMEKVNTVDKNDNCEFEFNYAVMEKPAALIAVPMESCMQNPSDWKGNLKATLGKKMYMASFDFDFDREPERFEDEVSKLAGQIKAVLGENL